MSQQSTEATQPWYKQFWPWFLIAIPLSSVLFGILMIYLAVHGRDTLVVDNYYKEGLEINESLSKDDFAAELGLQATFLFTDKQQVEVQLTAQQAIAPDHLLLKFFHPTLSGKDQTIQLTSMGGLKYSASLNNLTEGRWYLDLSDDQDLWRLKGETWLPRTDSLTLVSQAHVAIPTEDQNSAKP